ncbi:hypothetical protein K0M31_001825 [Melipona bicolor]|uniref:Uncharacterized protein n=1 Tax=Melipona bicolor TaxID=60889 RepID=A0AA40KY83_9HYME|nr:hypothetical protein K0M31_001825 [Melipona bicolor]
MEKIATILRASAIDSIEEIQRILEEEERRLNQSEEIQRQPGKTRKSASSDEDTRIRIQKLLRLRQK